MLIREGVESVLLTGMIAAALPPGYRLHINLNFALTWIVTLLCGWFAVEAIWPHMENIEHTMMIVTAAVLIYIFFNSRSIFAHAKEHVGMVKDSNIWTIHLTVFLICLREALESTVFLASEIKSDPVGVAQGLILGVIILSLIVYAMEKFGKSLVNKIMFRYVSYALLIAAVYYLFRGVTEILEHNFGLDLF